jgi:hypothetical protein
MENNPCNAMPTTRFMENNPCNAMPTIRFMENNPYNPLPEFLNAHCSPTIPCLNGSIQ